MSNEEDDMGEHSNIPSDLSDDNQMFSAEYKDGQLQIVEVSPYDKGGDNQNQMTYSSDHILPDLGGISDNEQTKYLQVLDTGKGLVQLDLLNFTIVKSADGSNTFQMVSTDSATAEDGDTTITCVLSSDDVDDENPVESYVMLQTDDDQDPYMYLQSPTTHEPTTETSSSETQPTPQITEKVSDKPKKLTPVQILEKAKALQKAKSFLSSATVKSKRGRKRKSDLPPPMELLSSPNFKLYLYSCKMCTFKCNAVKEMSAHKKSEHSGGSKGARAACLQCARCPYRGHTHTQLMKHVRDAHTKETTPDVNNSDFSLSTSAPVCPRPRLLQRSRNVAKKAAVQLDSEEVEAADVLVCGACGFESGDRPIFRRHIEVDHGATTTII